MGESVNNICTALYSLRSLFLSSISLGSSHWGSEERRLPGPIPNHRSSKGPGNPFSLPRQVLRFTRCRGLPGASAGLPKSSLDLLSAGSQLFSLIRIPSHLPEGRAWWAAGWYRCGDGRVMATNLPRAVSCSGLERQLHQRVLVTVAM